MRYVLFVFLVFISGVAHGAEETLPKYVGKLWKAIGTHVSERRIEHYLRNIKSGEDINARNEQGQTLAHAVAQAEISGSLEFFTMDYLRYTDLRFDVEDNKKQTPLDMIDVYLASKWPELEYITNDRFLRDYRRFFSKRPEPEPADEGQMGEDKRLKDFRHFYLENKCPESDEYARSREYERECTRLRSFKSFLSKRVKVERIRAQIKIAEDGQDGSARSGDEEESSSSSEYSYEET